MGNRGEESQTGGIFGLAPASILCINKADYNIPEHVFDLGAAVWRIRWAGSHSSGINLASLPGRIEITQTQAFSLGISGRLSKPRHRREQIVPHRAV
ncbi:MAG: hypothetical protein BVN35_04450 [Proteobacteria bacterium ST_bin11]|nr:MAG: hypothetical protein BVN35_04450 [Proteobacteria bacterium ST_bin11]